MSTSRFTFIPLPEKVSTTLSSKENQEDLLKWGLKGLIKLKFFNFNQEFKTCDKKDFVDCFFSDPSVLKSLDNFDYLSSCRSGKVDFRYVPCSEISMNFFDKLTKEENGLVRVGYLTECHPEYEYDMLLSDNLRQMLVLENHPSYDLYSNSERQQFIFQLFKHFCLGGAYCQKSDILKPYLNLTKSLYKELVSVEKMMPCQKLQVRSIIMKIVVYSNEYIPVFPKDPEHPQNFAFLIIDPFKRQVAALYHQFGAYVLDD